MNQSTIVLKDKQEPCMLRVAGDGKESGPAIHKTQVSFSSYRPKLVHVSELNILGMNKGDGHGKEI